jgi:DNA-binding beta-propeller fold protein YncE
MRKYVSLLAAALVLAGAAASASPPEKRLTPSYKVDISWPKLPLPHKWALGELGGLFVDSHDDVWIVQRPGTLWPYEKAAVLNPPTAGCCFPAPPVIEFDPAGNVVRSWGGPGKGYEWPQVEHGITVDYKGNVWIGGSATRPGKDGAPADGMLLKFSPEGKFLLQIGHAGPGKGSLDRTQLSGVADVAVDPQTNEVFVADGYGNHRIIVFDADTGAYKRMWGAYGKTPTDERSDDYDPAAPLPQQFRNVHCVKLSHDGLVYVCDRDNDRMQVFKRDGTFVAEYPYGRETRPPGTVGHISFWPDASQSILAIADLGNFQIRLVQRQDGKVLSTFGHFGNYSGELNRVHQIAFDSKGDLFIGEAAGKRVQKWVISNTVRPR